MLMLRPTTQISLIALLAVAPLGAAADLPTSACTPSFPVDSDVVTCTGTGEGFIAEDADNLVVTVETGAVISEVEKEAIYADDGLDLTNNGTVTSSEDDAIYAGDGSKVTNNGTITSTFYEDGDGYDAVDLGDDAVVINRGTISAEDNGVEVNNDGDITNSGSITGRDSGVRGQDGTKIVNEEGGVITGTFKDAIHINGDDDGDDADITNYGEIYGGDDGIYIDDDGIVRNYGTIQALEDAIDAWDDLQVINEGTLDAGDNGIEAEDGAEITNAETGEIYGEENGMDLEDGAVVRNFGKIQGRAEIGIEAGDDAEITNWGSILGDGDAINVDDNATIVNMAAGTIISDEEDAIDLDSGSVLNYGLIQSSNGEAAIDFDESDVLVSTITNHGIITGMVAINVALGDDEKSQAVENAMTQVVINHGTITGTGDYAMQLGAGADTLDIYSMDINGLVDLGDDEDTLIVRETVQNGVVYFASDPEILNMDEAPDTAVYDDLKLVVASRESFANADAFTSGQMMQLGKSALVPMPESTGGLAFADAGMGHGSWWATGSAGVFDGDASGRVSIGHDFDKAGVFVSYGRLSAASSADHDVISGTTVLGLHGGHGSDSGAEMVGIAYMGFGDMEVRSPASASGDGTAETRVFGLAGSISTAPTASGVSLVARAGLERLQIGAMTMSGLGGATFGARDVTTGFLSLEARLEHGLSGGMILTPFVGVDVLHTNGEDVSMTLGSGSTTFATGAGGTKAQMSIGTELSQVGQPWHLRLEGQYDDTGAAGASVTAGLRF
ncbi:hypothetical protein SAMN06297129_2378 [Pseudooceanicola antarcticus]|uniref:Autotransporter domain-containing protein n=2 Tax=Pseudooceanicola antarcticus TaxID=1247613 RepID=A0A285IYD0_9RHOB|nr:hypothetical protein SAMN06297129_2378 [Pseudooceanicola antarcticus]